jgi:tricarballylate dehydrogenase
MEIDRTVDVLVIGDGIAGCATAITAHEAGANVLVIDKAPENAPHGNTAFSGGSFRRVSDQYPAERFYGDILRLSGNRADPELTHIVVDNSARARDWLAELGVPWTTNARTGARANQSEQRGFGLAAALRSALRTRGVPVLNETAALALLSEGKRVVGARIRDSSGRESVLRAGAVVLASGGFGANTEMVQKYIGPGAINLVLRGSPYNTGDGLRMAEAVGAKLDWMDDFHGGLIHFGYRKYPAEGATRGMRSIKTYESCILVNEEGRRFVDEGEDSSDKTYAKFGKIIALTQTNGVAFAVGDSQSRERIDVMYYGPEKEAIEADTLEALAARLGLPKSNFLETISTFNADVQDGKAPNLSPPKANFATKIEKAPFYAYKVTGGFTFTFGGLRTNATGGVLDEHQHEIPGLFAVGEIATGIFYGNYAGGSSLARCAVFGRIVGFEAARAAVPEINVPTELWSGAPR